MRVFGLTVALIGVLFVACAVALLLTAYSAPPHPAPVVQCFPLYSATGGVSTYCPVATP